MNYSNQKDNTIVIKSKTNITQISIQNILYIICDSYVCSIFLIDVNKPEVVSMLLKKIEEELIQYGFLRINHNILINLKYVNNVKRDKKRSVLMSNGMELKISRRKWFVFKKVVCKSLIL